MENSSTPAGVIEQTQTGWVGRFQAMASPCEILIDTSQRALAQHCIDIARHEAWRIEQKFSRYRDDNIIHRIHHAHGLAIAVDNETADLLDYAAQCYQLSAGAFDITSGVLREVWRFDGSDRIPDPAAVQALLPRIGWDKVDWQRPYLRLPQGMQIDLGGIGKEYAVDRSAALLQHHLSGGALINYGGDIYALGSRAEQQPWHIGVDDPDATGQRALGQIALHSGGLATSGDARRYLLKDGVRYGHILDPRTGWPVPGAPRAVTVLAATCLEAGMLATLALLQGAEAQHYLAAQGVNFSCVW